MAKSLDSFPRVRLAHLPTPLEPLERLSAVLGGPEIWVKRDDTTGLAFGGNKVRKLEYLLGAAIAEDVDTVITIGGVQSNHARQTAAAAARLGLRCQLVLPRVVPRDGVEYEEGGNVLLDRLFGAEVFIVDDEEAALHQIQRLEDAARGRGRKAVIHPPGGSTPVGALGYVQAADELRTQQAAGAESFRELYIAVGTGGTLAGLLTGFALAASPIHTTAVCVVGSEAKHRGEVDRLLTDLADLLAMERAKTEAVRFEDGFLGEGYGIPQQATLEAVRLVAETEGLLLDPVYTGKAMAALISDIRHGRVSDGPILFWHTGGAPGLFAYRKDLTS